LKVAVINNDTDFLSLMNDLLNSSGWDTIVCRESNLAVGMVKADKPDIVVLDVRMETPESGWNVLELLKLDPDTRHLPIVVCSAAVGDLREREEWLRGHGVQTLPKPFDIDDLFAAINTALDRSGDGPEAG